MTKYHSVNVTHVVASLFLAPRSRSLVLGDSRDAMSGQTFNPCVGVVRSRSTLKGANDEVFD